MDGEHYITIPEAIFLGALFGRFIYAATAVLLGWYLVRRSRLPLLRVSLFCALFVAIAIPLALVIWSAVPSLSNAGEEFVHLPAVLSSVATAILVGWLATRRHRIPSGA